MYYIFVENNKINGAGEAKILNDEVINYEVSESLYNAYLENPTKYIWDGINVVENPNYEQEQAQKEAERVNMLTMTALDFITFLQQAGLTLEQINTYLEANLQVKMQLTYCQNVYCGVAKSFMPVSVGDITITADMVETAFKIKNGEITTDDNTTDTAQ